MGRRRKVESRRQLVVPGTQYCSECHQPCPKEGGGWIRISLLRQRWACAKALARLMGAKVEA